MQASPAEFPNRESQSPGKESVPPTDVDVLPSTSPPFSPTASPSRVANTLPGANTMTNGSIPNGSEAQAVSTTPQASHSTIPTTEASRDSHDAIPTLRPHTADSSAPASPGWESSAETPVDACNIRTSSTATNGQATPEPSPSPQRTDLAADAVQTGTGEGHGACGDFDDDVGDFAEGADEDGAEEAPKVEAAGGGVPGGDGGGRAGAVTAAASNEDGVGQDDFDDDFGDFEEGDGDAGAGATAAAAAAPVGSGAGSGVAGDASTAGRAGGVNVGDVQGSAAMQQFLQDLASMLPEDTWGDESGEGAEEEDAAVRLKRIAGDAEVPAAGAGACAATHRAALLRLLGLSEAAAAAEAAAEEDAAAERIGSVVDGGVSSTGGPAAASPRATVLSPRAAAASPRAAVASPRASPRGPAELARSVSTSDPFGAAAAVEQQQPGTVELGGAAPAVADSSELSEVRTSSGVLTGRLHIMEDFVGTTGGGGGREGGEPGADVVDDWVGGGGAEQVDAEGAVECGARACEGEGEGGKDGLSEAGADVDSVVEGSGEETGEARSAGAEAGAGAVVQPVECSSDGAVAVAGGEAVL